MLRSVLLALALGGCSIAYTKSVETAGPEKCSTSVGAPAADTLMVVGVAGFATYAAFELDDVEHIALPVAISLGIVYGVSALVGYSRASGCKREKIKNGLPY